MDEQSTVSVVFGSNDDVDSLEEKKQILEGAIADINALIDEKTKEADNASEE